MKLLDVNLLVYAHREDAPRHSGYRAWLQQLLSGAERFGVADLVFSGFLRVVTHPRIFDPPTDPELALKFVQTIRESAGHVLIAAGPGHWTIFSENRAAAAISFLTHFWRRSRLNRAAPGSPPIGTIADSTVSIGAIRWMVEKAGPAGKP